MMSPNIYLSYSWNAEDMSIADAIDKDWQAIGITLIRDKRDVSYKDSLRDFMSRMSEGDYVLLIISKSYLESKNCMYEALELFKNPNFKDKILPILAPMANIYDAVGKMSYARYWENKIVELESELSKLSSRANLSSIYTELDHYARIRSSIASFSDVISDMRGVSWPDIKEQNYEEIFKHIGYSVNESTILRECNRVLNIVNEEDQELELDKLEFKYKDNSNIIFTASSIAFTRKKFKKSRVALERIGNSHPRPWKVYHNLAQLLRMHFSDPNGARNNLNKALEIEPNYAIGHASLADLLCSEFSDYIGALEHYRKALQIDPKFLGAHINLASLLSDHFKDYKMAMNQLLYADKLSPNNPYILYNTAHILMECGEHDTARRGYAVACRMNPMLKTPEGDKHFGL